MACYYETKLRLKCLFESSEGVAYRDSGGWIAPQGPVLRVIVQFNEIAIREGDDIICSMKEGRY